MTSFKFVFKGREVIDLSNAAIIQKVDIKTESKKEAITKFTITRHKVVQTEFPRMSSIANREEVIFHAAPPKIKQDNM